MRSEASGETSFLAWSCSSNESMSAAVVLPSPYFWLRSCAIEVSLRKTLE